MTQWLRWWHGTATDPKWRTVARKSGQPIPSVLAVWALMLENASENATERGRTHEWDNDVAGDALGIEPSAVEAIVDAMQGLVLDGDHLKGWEKRQPKREDSSAERAKAWREKKANAAERSRTQRDAPEQIQNREEKKDPPAALRAAHPPGGDDPPAKPDVTIPDFLDRRKADARGTRLAPDWQPGPDERAYAAERGLDPDDVAERFRDFWHAKPGKDGRKADWPATWRTWCRRDADSGPGSGRAGPGRDRRDGGGVVDAAARVIARRHAAGGG